MEIRSYRAVFELERRIYRIDRLRLNPNGVPVRGLVYFIALAAAAVAAPHVPLVSVLARAAPWYVLYVLLPGLTAALVTVIRIEGRPFHLAARALVRHLLIDARPGARPRLLAMGPPPPGARWWPAEIVFLPDGSEGGLRRLSYTGPGAVLVRVAHRREGDQTARARSALRSLTRRPHVWLRPPDPGRAAADGHHGLTAQARRPGEPRDGTVIVLAHHGRMRVGPR
jgi:hypothetical protein